ncbi:occludin isoform X1 [Zalophus californianus]|uniref:Occludin n=2 Tax=Zalophus californianus TaxID=9704 RepID=A0A6J2E799_ZALCA|nr:occludin isoform X1 [Zalophus californianus]XP_027462803.1 occludin isoform X1 [Zalophus californianus]XP_027462804.1 occludin isoform X1 [Zalophus californianus]XP_027462805.1 occludin isoform X1 [Zalophus californianus]XP_027462806.1 occludin isoform X1 [Zalophus californianus]XP_027945431.1 occludin [Eumetopias jubatus]XP_027945432.1 occludin [Eumetopias jubatus]XP_027945433.1 occludin [Eumetopias jubatus]XP_027945434.1 occludin [Eumetopias jubatus]XP_027945435.1 occludin [Eumetopias
MSSRPFESPPPYRPDEFKPNHYAPSNDVYGGDMHIRPMLSQPAYSFYPEDEILHFYKWTSPPGVIRILSMLVIVMCIAIFACVASTLAWDRGYGTGVLGGGLGYPYSSGFGSYGSGYAYGYGYGYGYGGYTDPRAAKGFLLAMVAFCFIAALVVFVTSVIRSDISRTRRYYLTVIILSAILGVMMFIATIVYIMGVNPTAQASGSMYSAQIYAICNQFYASATTGLYMDQYLYHYCVVDPQEAIAIVLGFMVIVAFALIIFFAVKTRRKMDQYDKSNILWDKEHIYDEQPPNVEEWVKNVSAGTQDMPPPPSEYVERVDSPMAYSSNGKVNDKRLYPESSYKSTPVPEVVRELPVTSAVGDLRQPHYSSSRNFEMPSKRAPTKGRAGKAKRPEQDHYETDYTTGGESCDELEEDWIREYPPITSDQQRQLYKRNFDTGLQEYKSLQAELDEVNKELSRLDKELDDYREENEEYMAAADEYNRLKQVKGSADYKNKRNYCKQLKSKLSHIKKMVGDYDRQKT